MANQNPMPQNRPRVFVIDDDGTFRSTLTRYLVSNGFMVDGARTYLDAKTILKSGTDEYKSFDLILLDLNIAGQSGIDLLIELRREGLLKCPVIIISGDFNDSVVKMVAAQDVAGFLVKPFQPKALLEKIRTVLKLPLDPQSVKTGSNEAEALREDLFLEKLSSPIAALQGAMAELSKLMGEKTIEPLLDNALKSMNGALGTLVADVRSRKAWLKSKTEN